MKEDTKIKEKLKKVLEVSNATLHSYSQLREKSNTPELSSLIENNCNLQKEFKDRLKSEISYIYGEDPKNEIKNIQNKGSVVSLPNMESINTDKQIFDAFRSIENQIFKFYENQILGDFVTMPESIELMIEAQRNKLQRDLKLYRSLTDLKDLL